MIYADEVQYIHISSIIYTCILHIPSLVENVVRSVLSIWDARKDNRDGDRSDAISDCSSSCPLTGGPTSSACVCECVVNGVSTMAAS